jgi:NAD(P)-dependent dehydrogenase (short-subunit alcohol dehydrogenase family)
MKESPYSLKNKTILVTGASSGIGRASAIMAAEMGAKVIISGRDSGRLNECLTSLAGEGHICLPLDLMDDLAIKNFATQCPEIDGLVFAAGVAELTPFKMISKNHTNRLMQVNFFAPLYLTQFLVLKKKIQNSSSLVFISAVADHISPAGSTVYSSSKAALSAFVRTIALELAKFSIRANCVSPGYVQTPMLEKLTLSVPLGDKMKLSHLGIIQPEEVATGVVYLLSDAARWITRSTLVIDGGITIPIRK